MGEQKKNKVASKITFIFFKAIFAILVCLGFRYLVLKDNYWTYFFAVIVFAIPMVIYSCEKTTLRREYNIAHFKSSNNKAAKLNSIRWPIYIWNMLFCCILAFVLPVYVAILSKAEGYACIITLSLLLLAQYFITKFGQKTYDEKFVEYKISTWKQVLSIVVAAVVYSFLVCIFGGIDITKQTPFVNNQIAYVIDQILNGINTVSYALLNNDFSKQLAGPIYLAVSLFVLQGGLLFMALTKFFLFWFLPKDKIKSVFLPLSKNKAAVKKKQFVVRLSLFILVGILLISVVFQLLWIWCQKESRVKFVVDKTTIITEAIEEEIFRIGTSAKYAVLGEEFVAETQEDLCVAVNAYFDQMIEQTDNYLDWYYSLKREYTELFTFLVGALENQIEEKVSEFLNNKLEENITPDYNLEEEMNKIYTENYQKFQNAKELLFKENRIGNPNNLVQVQINVTIPEIISRTSPPENIMSGKQKALVTAGGGVAVGIASGIVTKKLLTKLSTKLTQKAATKAVATAAKSAVVQGSSKIATSALSGAVAGLAAGPAGVIVGIVVGAAASVGIEMLIMEIDESINREEYKTDILNCIEEERKYYLEAVASEFQ